MELNTAEIISRALKYLLEGLAVGLASYFVSKGKLDMNEIVIIAITAAATFAILDMYTPHISDAARLGAGIGIGSSFTGIKFIGK